VPNNRLTVCLPLILGKLRTPASGIKGPISNRAAAKMARVVYGRYNAVCTGDTCFVSTSQQSTNKLVRVLRSADMHPVYIVMSLEGSVQCLASN
jgi:hypothetical protein